MSNGDKGFTFFYAVHSSFSQDGANRPIGTLEEIKDVGRNDDRLVFAGPSIVGEGWDDAAHVFAGQGGIIYAVKTANDSGQLLRFIHTGVFDLTPKFVAGQGSSPIATGFHQFKHVFGGRKNVIYALRNDGTLLWFLDRDGTATKLEGGQVVGTGFDTASRIFAGELERHLYDRGPKSGASTTYRRRRRHQPVDRQESDQHQRCRATPGDASRFA